MENERKEHYHDLIARHKINPDKVIKEITEELSGNAEKRANNFLHISAKKFKHGY